VIQITSQSFEAVEE